MSGRRLETNRLLLRPPEVRDLPAMVALADDYDVAKNLARLPHPYTIKDGVAYLTRMAEQHAAGSDFHFAITLRSNGAYMGGIGLHLREGGLFELGYWLGRPFWGRGYATEAANRLVEFAFSQLRAERITAGYFHDNPASCHVLEKIGFVPCGAQERESLARGYNVRCLGMILERENFAAHSRIREKAS